MALDALTTVLDLAAGFGGGGSSSGGGGGSGGFSGGGFSGGSGSSGDGGDLGLLDVLIVLGFVALVWYFNPARKSRTGTSTGGKEFEVTRESDLWARFPTMAPGWDETNTEAYVQEAFLALNAAWSRGDADAMRPYLTPRMFDKMSSMVEALTLLGRRNEVTGLEVTSLVLEDASTARGPSFSVRVRARSTDLLRDADGGVLASSSSGVNECWRFVSDGTRWLLDEIEQPTRSMAHDVESIVRFAERSGLHYSADFGRLLLPESGVLFRNASMDHSDVNNHVIGHMDGVLVQLYTFEPVPDGDHSDDIVVAQTVLERGLGGILVRPRSAKGWPTPNMRELSFESNAFNERWRVHATDPDEVAAFELLHPALLERLAQLELPIGIEAVGRSLYIFDESGIAPYELMFDLLGRAHVELRR